MKRRMKWLCLLVLGFVFLIAGSEEVMATDRLVTIDRFLTKAYVNNREEAIPILNADVEIFYYDSNGQRQILLEGLTTNNTGEIKDVAVNVPTNINRIYFRYALENSTIGSIVNNKGLTYHPITSTVIPDNQVVNTESIRFFDNSTIENAKQYNYQAIKVWNLYQKMVAETMSSVQIVLKKFPELAKDFNYQFEPLPVLYEYNCERSKAAVLAKSSSSFGGIKAGDYYIHIPHLQTLNTMSENEQEQFFNINLSHEWAHWGMHLAIGSKMVVGYYQNHYSYNINEGMSYKEGWALFQSNRYTYGYDWNYNLDTATQTSKEISRFGKYEDCFGKSTNWTTNSVLRDIYDRETPREPEDQFDIAKDWLSEVGLEDNENRKQLSTGLMFIAMVNSEASTLYEYIDYLKTNYFIKDNVAFDQILELNGFDTKGRFTLDGEGNPVVYE